MITQYPYFSWNKILEFQFIFFSPPSRNIIKKNTSDFDKWHFRLLEKLK